MGESLGNLLWGSRLNKEEHMKSGANFADRNRIKRMVEGDEVNAETGDLFTVDQISAILQIQPAVVDNWVRHYLGEDEEESEPEEELVVEEVEEEDEEDESIFDD